MFNVGFFSLIRKLLGKLKNNLLDTINNLNLLPENTFDVGG